MAGYFCRGFLLAARVDLVVDETRGFARSVEVAFNCSRIEPQRIKHQHEAIETADTYGHRIASPMARTSNVHSPKTVAVSPTPGTTNLFTHLPNPHSLVRHRACRDDMSLSNAAAPSLSFGTPARHSQRSGVVNGTNRDKSDISEVGR